MTIVAILSKKEIKYLIEQEPPLLQGYIDLEAQLQPNGVDLTIRDIASFQSAGRIGLENSQRMVSQVVPLIFDSTGFIHLAPGPYLITFNEIVSLPRNIMALARPRSSLLRSGVTVENAVWDAGYSGRSQGLLVVHNPLGFDLQKNARVAQMIFMKLEQETEGYKGTYQGENLPG